MILASAIRTLEAIIGQSVLLPGLLIRMWQLDPQAGWPLSYTHVTPAGFSCGR